MQTRALSALVVLAAWSCGPGRPDFDFPPDPVDAEGAEASLRGETGIRILSDVGVPREAPSTGAARDASARDREVDGDASFERDVGNPVEARADAQPDHPRDAASDGPAGVDADISDRADGEAGDQAPLTTCEAVRECAHGDASMSECLRAASPAALAGAEAVLRCEREACIEACTRVPDSIACRDCLLVGCPSAIIACTRSSGCGDGAIRATEECDDGNDESSDACTNACTRARCGDAIVFRGNEECDDGNESDVDGCTRACRLAVCGDGKLRAGVEGCDDGNRAGGDGCSPTCQIESCGNGVVDPMEECDDGLANGERSPCLATCRVNRCGDGKVCDDAAAGCGTRLGTKLEPCDDANASNADACLACQPAACGDGEIQVGIEGCDDANRDPFDACGNDCAPAANHLILSEVVTRPAGAEMIEIANPTPFPVILSDYVLSDSHLYYKIATGAFTTASGSDFAARFPEGFVIRSGQYVVVALANASGSAASFEAVYGRKPDFELRPTANGAADDPAVPNMVPAQPGSSVGATASLTDGGEPIVLFVYRGGDLVSDADYLFFGSPSAANPVVDKTGVVVSGSAYHDDTPSSSQHPVAAPIEGGSIHRCIYAESDEKRTGGNGISGHDETSEDAKKSFALSTSPAERTPGGPPPLGVCGDR